MNAIAQALGIDPGELDLLADYPLTIHCNCTRDRALLAVLTMGVQEMQSLEAERGEAELTCHFCGKAYRVAGEELHKLIEAAEA